MTKKEPVDFGTAERHKHNKAMPQLTGKGREFRLRIVDGTAIDRLLMKDRITLDQYATLDHFSEDLYRADLMGLHAADFEPRVTSGNNQDVAHDVAMRRVKVNEIILHMDENVGAGIRRLVVSVCLDEIDPHPTRDKDLERGVECLYGYYES